MSAPGGGTLRLRLLFDYPPPATPESCQCWLLLEGSACRFVTDLSDLIRRKFGFSSSARLCLYLQESLLPPCEGIAVVRDNDCIRVKLEEVHPAENVIEAGNYSVYSPRESMKRPMQKSEEELEKEDGVHRKKKRKKKKKKKRKLETEAPPSPDLEKKSKKRKIKPESMQESGPEGQENGVGQMMKKKKKKKKKQKEGSKEIESENKNTKGNHSADAEGKQALDGSVTSNKGSSSKREQQQTVKKVKQASSSDSSDTSSTSSNEGKKSTQPSRKSHVSNKKKDAPQPVAGVRTTDTAASNLAAPTTGFAVQRVIDKTAEASSTSDSNPNEEAGRSKLKKKCTETQDDLAVTTAPSQTPENGPPNPESSDSSDSDSFVIREPTPRHLTGPNRIYVGNGNKHSPVIYGPNPMGGGRGLGRGCGRGEGMLPWRGPRGRGRMRGRGRGVTNNIPYDYSHDDLKQQQLNQTVTSSSIIIQNPIEIPKKDYSTMPLLAAAPQVGQTIAFKLLELTENYTPEVSEYKIAGDPWRRILGRAAVVKRQCKELTHGQYLSTVPAFVPRALQHRLLLMKGDWRGGTPQETVDRLRTAAVKEPGKFDLVYESASGRRVVEYAVAQEPKEHMKKLHATLSNKIENVSSAFDELTSQETKVRETVEKKKALLKEEFSEISTIIQLEELKVMKSIEDEEKRVKNRFGISQHALQKKKKEFENLNNKIETLLNEDDDIIFLMKATKLNDATTKDAYVPRIDCDHKLLHSIYRGVYALKELLRNHPSQNERTALTDDTFGMKNLNPFGPESPKKVQPHDKRRGDQEPRKQPDSCQKDNPGEKQQDARKPKKKGKTNPNTPDTSSSAFIDMYLKSREEILKYAEKLTLDFNTAHKRILLTERNTKISVTDNAQNYSENPQRFTHCSQVLGFQGFSKGIHYWEVDIQSSNFCGIGVSYKSIERRGADSRLGRNRVSWCIEWFNAKLSAWHNDVEEILPNPSPSKVGVLLNCDEGQVLFFSHANKTIPLYKFQARFTEAVYPAFWVFSSNTTLALCPLK